MLEFDGKTLRTRNMPAKLVAWQGEHELMLKVNFPELVGIRGRDFPSGATRGRRCAIDILHRRAACAVDFFAELLPTPSAWFCTASGGRKRGEAEHSGLPLNQNQS